MALNVIASIVYPPILPLHRHRLDLPLESPLPGIAKKTPCMSTLTIEQVLEKLTVLLVFRKAYNAGFHFISVV